MLKIARVVREAYNEGVAEGKAEGEVIGMIRKSRQVVCDYLDAKFGFESIDMQEKVKDLISLDVLDKTLKHLFNTDSLEQARTVIEEAIRAQVKLNRLQ